MKTKAIPVSNRIKQFFHCSKCISEMPSNVSPRDWAQLEVGFTTLGVQVWCKRHELNVVHIDFEGVKHPASTLALRLKESK